jgi:hypothetical protein
MFPVQNAKLDILALLDTLHNGRTLNSIKVFDLTVDLERGSGEDLTVCLCLNLIPQATH